MKLSILPVSLFPELNNGTRSIAEWGEIAQDSGADGFDVSAMFFRNSTPAFIDAVERELRERAVTIQPTMVCTYPDFTNPDALERERQLDYLRRDIALASRFGFRFVRITAGMNHEGMSFNAACRRVAECFARADDIARRYGISLVFENHGKPGAWPLRDFSFDPEAFYTLCHLTRNTGVGVNFDTANALACGEDPARMLERVINRVMTLHMNDTATVGKDDLVRIGTGRVNFDSIFAVLERHRFDGWVCIEEASFEGLDGIRKAIQFARRYVKEKLA